MTVIAEYKPGEGVDLHFHHGVEAVYVVQGASVHASGKDAMALPTGATVPNLLAFPGLGDEREHAAGGQPRHAEYLQSEDLARKEHPVDVRQRMQREQGDGRDLRRLPRTAWPLGV
ncbi:hypothetical protein J7E70_23580 [Variovorax paradoxus]|nr:hypothetical protein [Variovorax paradoxus]MBT2303435.1 hypothetical protein [Variovorax paradoxus]